MVKQELIQWIYLWKTQKRYLFIPLAIILICLLVNSQYKKISENMAVLILFPCLVFPVTGLYTQIGSSHQKELFITFPMSSWAYGAFRPLLLSVVYSALYLATIAYVDGNSSLPSFSIFVSAVLFMLITALCIALFKNSAFGMCLPLVLLFFGLFTTGSGLGPLYLLQWYRPEPGTTADQFVLEQVMLCFLVIGITVGLIRYRDRFHLV